MRSLLMATLFTVAILLTTTAIAVRLMAGPHTHPRRHQPIPMRRATSPSPADRQRATRPAPKRREDFSLAH